MGVNKKSGNKKSGKSGRAEADALDKARQDAESKQSAADEREAPSSAPPDLRLPVTERLLPKFCRSEWKSEDRSVIKR